MLRAFLRSFALGVATAGRTFTPIAVIGWASSTDRLPINPGPLPLLNNPLVVRALKVTAVGEIVIDKFPFVPNRTMSGSLVARTALGGVSAAIMASKTEDSAGAAACIGGLSAAIFSFVLMRGRRAITEQGAPDALVALVEDALVILLSRAATRASFP
jgi:uncharacterized membrane protein